MGGGIIMRKAMFILSAMAMVAAASCTKEIVDTNKGTASDVELFPMTFTASSQQTKAEIVDAQTIHWQSGDQINVFDANGTAYGPFTTSDKGASVTFEGMAGKAEGYYALYPYQSSATMTDGTIIATFPSEQTAVAGSFDPKAFISVAQSDAEGNFSFKNVAALVKFTMPEGENATSATLTANADKELLCGPVKITFDENGNPSAPSAGKMTNAVTLKGNLEGGKTYYFVVRPGIAFSEGLTISIDGKKYRTSSTKLGKTLVRNSVMALPEFTFKEGMPKDLYTAYEHGFDLQIGGQKFDKATYGDATLITTAISAPKAGIYFLNPGVEQPIGSNVEHMAIIGRYADQRSVLTRTNNCQFNSSANDDDCLILANVDFRFAPDAADYVFNIGGNSDFENIVFDNIKVNVKKQRLIYFGTASSAPDRMFTGNITIMNSDIICDPIKMNIINVGLDDEIESVKFINNVITSASKNLEQFRIFSTTTAKVKSFEFDSNTLINLYPTNASFIYYKGAAESLAVESFDNNLFYMPDWAIASNVYMLRETTYTAAKNDSFAVDKFTGNYAYYGSGTPEKTLRNLYNCSTSAAEQLTTAPFTSDQIAAGNFALPEGTTYGAKR